MTRLSTPYRFVPTAPFVLTPEWAEQASHDHPFIDGLSGELAIEIRNDTPLCLGGKQIEATVEAAGKVHCNRTPDGKLAIPGSSLKGMLRNALAPVVFARMSQVEERKLSVRDISATGTYYHQNIVQKKASAGWLRFAEGQWQIKGCSHVRIHQADIIEHLKLNEHDWKKADTVKKRYELLKGVRTLQFDQEAKKTLTAATNLGKGAISGSLVVTGQPGNTFDKGRSAKKWEFVFYAPQDKWYPLSEQALTDFLFVHENSEEWAFLRNQGHQQTEIPVFFHGTVGDVKSMGLASMYRLAQKNSLHDALRNISAQHLDANNVDLTELLFGRLQPEQAEAGNDWGLRGRVNIGLFQAAGSPETKWTVETVLSSPKASFHPAYLQQPNDDSYTTLDSKAPKLQGWKRYPVKPDYVQSPPPMEDGKEISNKVKVSLETINENTSFTGKIRFHNLRPVELGALLWILDFGGKDELRHALGMGKPFGLGQIKINLTADNSRVVANDRAALSCLATADILAASQQVFVSYMDDVWQTVADTTHKNSSWEASPQVVSLLTMADPVKGMQLEDELRYLVGPKPFLEVKKNQETLQDYAIFDQPNWNEATHSPVLANANMSIAQAREHADLVAQQQQEKAALVAARADMLAGEKILSEVKETITDAEDLTKTLVGNIAKEINSIANIEPEERPTLEFAEPILQLAEGCDKERINKAVKKIRKLLTPE
ncbi:CRISPR-associated RAMP family protein [Oceanisphaera profunda]|uniref:CRISPR-associated RAMP family protein n=1 Tax=Oceanisphaera profunda TaxID=1416627 RepID=A0A1Y0D7E7_9GAMM|nr:TIGR03986 family CRISPR-associated RAMP protein [Oceanisphaera profunda]ART83450.1 CRISPR-associated RAMP family protein [Oceanisphaera profunda]